MLTVYDELIAALRFCDGGECDGCCEYKKEHGCNTLLRDAADAIEALSIVLESYRNRMKAGCDWIPVTERLPEEDGWYQVYAPCYSGGSSSGLKNINGNMYSAFKKGKWSIEVGYHKRPGCVVAKMPLPDPPGEEPDA